MRVVETDWWTLDLPDEWEAEQDEETIVIGDEDGVGVLEISTLEKQDSASAADLQELARSLIPTKVPGTPIVLGEFNGLYFEYEEEGDSVREWLLRGEDLLLLVSYSCALENHNLDAAMVDEILETLQLVPFDQLSDPNESAQ